MYSKDSANGPVFLKLLAFTGMHDNDSDAGYHQRETILCVAFIFENHHAQLLLKRF